MSKTKLLQKLLLDGTKIIESPAVDTFCQKLIGQVINDIARRGKFLIFEFTDFDLISHLRMEGKYEYTPKNTEAPVDKHTHVIFKFTDGSQLSYHDVRKFGRMALVEKGQYPFYKGIKQLGPEPVEEEFHCKHLRKNYNILLL